MESSATVSIIPSRGLIFALACLVAGGLMVYSLSRKKRHWNQEAARIKKLIIYPIKSVPGVEVDCLLVAKTGVSYGDFNDR